MFIGHADSTVHLYHFARDMTKSAPGQDFRGRDPKRDVVIAGIERSQR